MKLIFVLLISGAFVFALAFGPRPASSASPAGRCIAYVGTYTREPSKGIYAFRFDAATGTSTPMGLIAESANPSFLAVHPDGRHLYAVNETSEYQGQQTGAVSAFSIEAGTGRLALLNQVPSGGTTPCHLALDNTGKWVVAANYGTGSASAFPIKADGSLGASSSLMQHAGSSVDPKRQAGPHAHGVFMYPRSDYMLVPDLGLDQVFVYRLDSGKGTLAPADPPFAKIKPGSGPRHIAFYPNGRFAYVVSEMQATVTAFSYDALKGRLEEIQTVPMLAADDTAARAGAEIAVHPNGKFLYASNRGAASLIAIFAIDAATGKLTPIDRVPTQGKDPRHFAIDPTGNYLFVANQSSANIVVFRVDQTTGRLTPTGKNLDVPLPVCIVFVPAE
jgi:6-phosphogluconolactonase